MKRKLSVVIAAHNEARTIGPVVRRLLQWYRRPEVVVIANGCTDGTARIAKSAGARVIRFKNKLGPDIGRAIGIVAATGDMYLVVDADMLIPLRQLEPFVKAIERGVDIAINHYPFLGTKQYHHPTAVAKNALNIFANRSDLRAASLTAVPHAISHRAVTRLGPLAFCVPPVAQARAICSGLRVEIAGGVGVGALNRSRTLNHEKMMRRLIIGDCLEGMAEIIAERGERGEFTDLNRRRDLAEVAAFSTKGKAHRVAVIPTQGEENLRSLVRSIEAAEIEQIRLVVNGLAEPEKERMEKWRHAIKIDYFDERVGHDVGRAIGCMQVDSDVYFITDADIPLVKDDIEPFLNAVDTGVDVALNDLNKILSRNQQIDPPSVVKRFLNLACDRPDLGVASLTAVPHAISGRCVRSIGVRPFSVPPVAHVEALLRGHQVAAVHAIDVITTNAQRPELHSIGAGRPLQRMIIGDHIEAIARLQAQMGDRAGFPDELRRRDIAKRYLANHWLARSTRRF